MLDDKALNARSHASGWTSTSRAGSGSARKVGVLPSEGDLDLPSATRYSDALARAATAIVVNAPSRDREYTVARGSSRGEYTVVARGSSRGSSRGEYTVVARGYSRGRSREYMAHEPLHGPEHHAARTVSWSAEPSQNAWDLHTADADKGVVQKARLEKAVWAFKEHTFRAKEPSCFSWENAGQTSTGNIPARVKRITPDGIIVSALGSSGHEEFRIPSSLLPEPPQQGVTIVLTLHVQQDALALATAIQPAAAGQRQEQSSQPSISETKLALRRAYADIDALLAQRQANVHDPELDQRIQAAWAHLDKLQDASYEELRQELDGPRPVELSPQKLQQLIDKAHAALAKTTRED